MAVLSTGDITLPKTIAAGLWERAQTGSTVSALSGSEPMKFGEVDIMTFETRPRAEYVGEGGDKASSEAGFGLKTASPHKVHVTMRFNQEVQWADEDHQLNVLNTLSNAGADALARALDLGVYHAVNPLTGATVASITEKITDTTNRAELAGNPDVEFETAAGLVIADEWSPNGVAFDPKFAWTLATARYDDGRKKFPDLGLGQNVSNFMGLNASVSTTVSGVPEAADTNVRAIVGDFTQLRWGVQRQVPVEMIQYGDPDGQGDLKRKNQIALRLEVVYGWAIMALDAFALLTAPTAP